MRTTLTTVASTTTITLALILGGCKSSTTPAPASQPASSTTSTTAAPAAQPVPAPAAAPAPAPSYAATAPGGAPLLQPSTAPGVASAPGAIASTEPRVPTAPARLTASAGSRVAVTITETLKASTSNVGDGFTGVLAEPVVARGGGTVFARGTRVAGTVVASKGRGRFKGAGALGIELTSIGGVRVSSSEYEKAEKGRGKRTGALVGGGAGLGAIIGGLAGGGKGALIGGLAGAGGGAAGAAYTGNHDVTIPSESLVTFTLRSAVSR